MPGLTEPGPWLALTCSNGFSAPYSPTFHWGSFKPHLLTSRVSPDCPQLEVITCVHSSVASSAVQFPWHLYCLVLPVASTKCVFFFLLLFLHILYHAFTVCTQWPPWRRPCGMFLPAGQCPWGLLACPVTPIWGCPSSSGSSHAFSSSSHQMDVKPAEGLILPSSQWLLAPILIFSAQTLWGQISVDHLFLHLSVK